MANRVHASSIICSMKYLYTLVILFLFLPCKKAAWGQGLSETLDVPLDLLHRVNSIESFIKRFNYREDLTGNGLEEMETTDQNIAKRNQYILSLFDYEKLNNTDSAGKDKIYSFLKKVNSKYQQITLDFYDRGWYAEVHMDVLYKKRPEQLTLVLVNEQSHPRVSHWAIKAVKADFLNIYRNEDKNDTANIIPPNSHGTDFVGIPQQFSNHDMIKNYTSSSVKPDILSIFLYASQNGEIEFKSCKNISYHFLQISDWIVRVKEITRNGPNSGWLVAELIKADKDQKFQYESNILHVHNP
jgi:hypothetical protein